MHDKMDKHEKKMKKSSNHREKVIQSVKSRLEGQNEVWEQRRKRQSDKPVTIDTSDY